MNGSAREVVVEKQIVNEVNLLLVVDEDQGAHGHHADQEVNQGLALLLFINVDDLK